MSEEEIIDIIEEEYDEKYLLIEALRNIFKGKKEEYDIQIITSQLLALYKEEKEKNQEIFNEYNKRVATIIKYEQGIKCFLDETNISDIEPCNVYTIGGNLLFELEELLEE